MNTHTFNRGKAYATADSNHSIRSNYYAVTQPQKTGAFKFGINGKDNEMKPLRDHQLVIPAKAGYYETAIILFGKLEEKPVICKKIRDSQRAQVHLTVFIELATPLKQDDQLAIYGDFGPLNWDFADTRNKAVKIDETHYKVNLMMPPLSHREKSWTLSENIEAFPQLKSEHTLLNALYKLSLEETQLDIRKDKTFMAGKEWNGVWTRDISYAIMLAHGFTHPEVSKNSLRKKVKNKRIIQDTGTGGSWPVSTDRMIWTSAAWEVYLVTGDKDWLKEIYPIIKNSIDTDRKVCIDSETGLYYGESSFLDWREQTYPRWMEPSDIYRSQCLGTNAGHYNTLKILARIGKILGKESQAYADMAEELKNKINQYLWLAEKGYYAQYLYGKNTLSVSDRSEALGEALCILFGIASEKQAESIMKNSPVTEFGVPCIFPQIPNIPPYHNDGIWPFVVAFHSWAGAQAGSEQSAAHAMKTLMEAAAFFVTNKENMVCQTGNSEGTQINSDRQLWSVAGNLAMTYRILFGMRFEEDGLHFSPVIPKGWGNQFELTNIRYRNASLKIKATGTGSVLKSFKLDGVIQKSPFIPAELTGQHTIEIEMDSSHIEDQINLTDNQYSPETPEIELKGNTIEWPEIADADKYLVYKNGQLIKETENTQIKLQAEPNYAEYQVCSISTTGHTSFLSKPAFTVSEEHLNEYDTTSYGKAKSHYKGFSGQGYLEISTSKHTNIEIPITIQEEGVYRIDARYSNGSGSITTDNKAAIRSLFIDQQRTGSIIMPQRGEQEYENWGWSALVKTTLSKGKHILSIRYTEDDINMNETVNDALLDKIRIIKIQ